MMSVPRVEGRLIIQPNTLHIQDGFCIRLSFLDVCMLCNSIAYACSYRSQGILQNSGCQGILFYFINEGARDS